MAELLHQHLLDHGIALHLEKKALGISQKGAGLTIDIADGDSLDTDIVLLAIGVRPRTKLAKDAGLEIGVTGGIRVDDRMITSDPDIFAVGDAIEITNPATGLPGFIPLAGPANRQGRIAADQIFGRDSRYRGTLGTSICKVFELGAGAVGVSEKVLKKLGKTYQKSYVHAGSHANYYPGSYAIALKLLFDPKAGTIYGAQAIGADGVDKRIDVIASAMYAGLTVFDLEHFELSYSPPYGSAKNPVNMAGFVAANIIRGDHRIIHADALSAGEGQGAILLDVRTAGEYRAGNIEGSLNIPVNELRGRISELPKGKKIIVYCQVGLRGYVAQRMLSQSGFDAVNLSGGYRTWLMVNRLLSGIR
jgi:rhodanese-related sulfurtransferase